MSVQNDIVSPPSNQAEALRLAALGFAVYPVWGIGADGKCLCGGMAGCHPGKHPWGAAVPHGEKDASTDADVIRQWFRGSAVNVGVSISGFVVLDADRRHGGMETLAAWEQEHGAMPLTPTVATGGGQAQRQEAAGGRRYNGIRYYGSTSQTARRLWWKKK